MYRSFIYPIPAKALDMVKMSIKIYVTFVLCVASLHMKKQKLEKGKPKFSCPALGCDQIFKKKAKLKEHVATCKKFPNLQSKLDKFPDLPCCQTCGIVFQNNTHYLNHVSAKHLDLNLYNWKSNTEKPIKSCMIDVANKSNKWPTSGWFGHLNFDQCKQVVRDVFGAYEKCRRTLALFSDEAKTFLPAEATGEWLFNQLQDHLKKLAGAKETSRTKTSSMDYVPGYSSNTIFPYRKAELSAPVYFLET